MQIFYHFKHLVIVYLCLILFSASLSAQQSGLQVISGATLFDGTGSDPIENGVIVVRDDKIECIGSEVDCEIPNEASKVDASGKYITPGLVDAHVHFFQSGFFDSRPDAMDITDTYPLLKLQPIRNKIRSVITMHISVPE